jgi:hypothetical protein
MTGKAKRGRLQSSEAQMAQVLPFPLARRVDLVRKHADLSFGMRAELVDAHIRRQVDVQRQALLRKGVDPDRVERECKELAAAIHAEIWSIVFTGRGGGAA